MRVIVIAHPHAKHTKIEKDLEGNLHIYVNAPPLDGKANKVIIETLAEYFHVKKNMVMLMQGDKSKHKVFEVLND